MVSFVSAKKWASPNFAQPRLTCVPNFLYLRESDLDISKIMFKGYTSNDNLLLPPCLGDFIPQNDPVRVAHRIIEQINLEELYRKYFPKGCSAYHPRMMFQILVYAYLCNIYSSHRIEEFCRNDIRFMWLTGNVTPDHNTINRFRSSRLKDALKTTFATIVKFLVAEGFVSLDVACTDGTKMEANDNHYTFVWGKSIHACISRIAEQLEENTPSPSPSRNCVIPLLSHIRISSRRKWERHSRQCPERSRCLQENASEDKACKEVMI